MKKIFFLAVMFSLLPLISFSNDKPIGLKAPDFIVRSGDNKELSLSDIKGKVITIFYETKNEIEKNRKLKTELNKFYEEQPEAVKEGVYRLAIVNCNGVIFSGAWKSALRENSEKEGITIYGDWSGKMASAYKAKNNSSNFIIIDKHGVIRYYACGIVNDKEINKIKDLLKKLIKEK
ncbi:MAG: peroxiredoxin family protein [Candidatus Omnitrophica bacterium]|jgi:peroxiredoxin|nr:peroxiredoxin family protein [Candidatus Omnitrophota bacterium]